MPDINDDEMKRVMKDALKEWMDEKFQETQQNVGKWTINFFLASVIGALTYLILTANGWHK